MEEQIQTQIQTQPEFIMCNYNIYNMSNIS